MRIQIVGCNHQNTPIAIREQLAFSPDQTRAALGQLREEFPYAENVLLSTCNRVEFYLATENSDLPTLDQLSRFLATFHDFDVEMIRQHLYVRSDQEAIHHLFRVTASLDSMVIGESQILSQVKQAYQLASQQESVGPLMHAAFQTAIKVARRVASETTIYQRRVSIPSVAVADFAQQIFEHFEDKNILVLGAGDMAEETLRYLQDEGARNVTVLNRSHDRAIELAQRWHGKPLPWDALLESLVTADLVVSTTGAEEPIVTLEQFERIESARYERLLFVLDLAVPRDFDPAIGERPGVYLYSVDDLRAVCDKNRQQRDKELPTALRIIEQETGRFMAQVYHRATGPIIRQLKQGWQQPKEEELQRLFYKLPDLDDRARNEISQSFDRLVNKLLHPPLESLRDESRNGVPHGLIEALVKLFQLRD